MKAGLDVLGMTSKAIVNYYSAGGKAGTIHNLATPANTLGLIILSGALTANVYKKILSSALPGAMDLLIIGPGNTTSRTLGLKLVLDGVDAFDAVSAAVEDCNLGMTVIGGGIPAASQTLAGTPRTWKSSMEVWVKSSNSETNLVLIEICYDTK